MRISDWSSDVCSSDLPASTLPRASLAVRTQVHHHDAGVGGSQRLRRQAAIGERAWPVRLHEHVRPAHQVEERLAARLDRKSGGEGKRVSVRVDIGGGRIIKKKKQKENKKQKTE